MPRTLPAANTYISNLQLSFATEVYTNSLLRARGLNQPPEYNKNFPIFNQALSDNTEYGTLSDLQRDSIIDYLLR